MVLFYTDDAVVNAEGPVRLKGNLHVVIKEGIVFRGELIILCPLTSSLCPQAACYLIGCGTFIGPHFPLPWSQRWALLVFSLGDVQEPQFQVDQIFKYR